jgi:F420H(2)-dependent quinone reductase
MTGQAVTESPRVAAVWPAYDDYQAKTDRQVPVGVLTPSA